MADISPTTSTVNAHDTVIDDTEEEENKVRDSTIWCYPLPFTQIR